MNLPSGYEHIIMHTELENILTVLTETNDDFCVIGPGGCLTGDTEIRLSRAKKGFRLSLKTLYERFNGLGTYSWDTSFLTYVRSYDEQEKRIRLNQVISVLESGVKPIFELELINGVTLRGTYEHKIMTTEGWKELGTLCSSDVVLVDATTKWSKTGKITEIERKKSKKRNADIKIRIGPFYPNKRIGWYKKNRVPTYQGTAHILTYEAFLNKVDIQTIVEASYLEEKASQYTYVSTKTHAVHHKDGVHRNNEISNLELVTHKEHTLLHAEGSEVNFKHGIPYRVGVKEVRDLHIEEMTYDIECKAPHHSFVANNIVVHNSGKTELLKMCCDKRIYNHNTIVCAPTAISAVNASNDGVQATTIHSLFRLPPMSIIPPDRLTTHSDLMEMFDNLHTIIIEEISMVNSDLLSKIHYLLQQYTYRNVRFIIIGDPSQLAPIVSTQPEKEYLNDMYGTKFFFGSDVFKRMKVLHLSKIFRQRDQEFADVLNKFRFDAVTNQDRKYINSRVIPIDKFRQEGDFVYVAMTNKKVDAINNKEVGKNKNPPKTYTGVLNSGFSEKDMPVPLELILKEGVQVLVSANNYNAGYYNGMIARVTKLEDDVITVVTPDDEEFTIEKFIWKKYGFSYDREKGTIEATQKGTYQQFPLKIAYALTSHKTQGLTLDRVYLDLERGTFSSGQLYTSLSRCRTLQGLGLARAVTKRDNKLHYDVKNFYREYT